MNYFIGIMYNDHYFNNISVDKYFLFIKQEAKIPLLSSNPSDTFHHLQLGATNPLSIII